MRDLIAVFQSRRDAMAFGRALGRFGVSVRAVTTPSAYGSGCGLSVRFPRRGLAVAERVLSSGEYQSFKGIYEV